MGVAALVMAGGKGTRMGNAEEKPLVKVCGKPVIEYVLEALKKAEKVDSVVVAVSGCTPETAKFAENFNVKVLETPGNNYVSDLGYAAQTLKLGVFLAIAADLPLVTGEILDCIVERYECCGKPALTVAVPLETKIKLGMSAEYSFKMGDRGVVPVGINVIDGHKRYGDEWLDQDIFLLDKDELAVNINTPKELQIAEKLLASKKVRSRNKSTQSSLKPPYV
jgi:adenosylcobinamide-phosphate guanylyltransferase